MRYQAQLWINNESQFSRCAQCIAKHIAPGQSIGLSGEMGSGKTTFVRHLAAHLGSEDWVNSPSYVLVQHYESPKGPIVHVDLYRCSSINEIDHLDIDSWMGSSIVCIEWSNKIPNMCFDIQISIDIIDVMTRRIHVMSENPIWIEALQHANADEFRSKHSCG